MLLFRSSNSLCSVLHVEKAERVFRCLTRAVEKAPLADYPASSSLDVNLRFLSFGGRAFEALFLSTLWVVTEAARVAFWTFSGVGFCARLRRLELRLAVGLLESGVLIRGRSAGSVYALDNAMDFILIEAFHFLAGRRGLRRAFARPWLTRGVPGVALDVVLTAKQFG